MRKTLLEVGISGQIRVNGFTCGFWADYTGLFRGLAYVWVVGSVGSGGLRWIYVFDFGCVSGCGECIVRFGARFKLYKEEYVFLLRVGVRVGVGFVCGWSSDAVVCGS